MVRGSYNSNGDAVNPGQSRGRGRSHNVGGVKNSKIAASKLLNSNAIISEERSVKLPGINIKGSRKSSNTSRRHGAAPV